MKFVGFRLLVTNKVLVLMATLVGCLVITLGCNESASAPAEAEYADLTDIQAIQIVKEHLAGKEFSYLPPSKPSECDKNTSDACVDEPVRVVGYCRTLVEGSGIWSVVHLPEYSLWRVRVARSEPFWGDMVLYWDLYQHTGYINAAFNQIKC